MPWVDHRAMGSLPCDLHVRWNCRKKTEEKTEQYIQSKAAFFINYKTHHTIARLLSDSMTATSGQWLSQCDIAVWQISPTLARQTVSLAGTLTTSLTYLPHAAARTGAERAALIKRACNDVDAWRFESTANIDALAGRIYAANGDSRERSHLFQRRSIAIQMGDAACSQFFYFSNCWHWHSRLCMSWNGGSKHRITFNHVFNFDLRNKPV